MSLKSILLGISVILLLGVLASKASARLGIPALLLFLLIGIFAGSEGPGGVKFDYPRLTQSVGVVALIFILFAGGLDRIGPVFVRFYGKGWRCPRSV